MSKFSGKFERSVLNGLQFSQYGSVAGNAWWGLTAVASLSNGNTATVSTTLVKSDSIITLTAKVLGPLPGTQGPAMWVSSVVDGTSFIISTASVAGGVTSFQAMWFIANPVKVDGVE